MNTRRRRFSPADSLFQETLESRIVLSAIAIRPGAAEVAARRGHRAATATGLSITGGTLGQPTTFTVTVRAPASAGAPRGTVKLVDHGKIIQTLTLTPVASTGGRFAYGTASYTLAPQPGGDAIYIGRYSITAKFVPSGPFAKSSVTKTFVVAQPDYSPLAGGVKVATIANGSGPAIQAGQKAEVLYTGFLAKTGAIFDNSLSHGGTPLGFTLGAQQVIPGFDAGITGMRAGETRIIEIPPSQGYGSMSNGSIPGNSTLVFIVTLQSIG
jgi:peptidylprolyl isomerase